MWPQPVRTARHYRRNIGGHFKFTVRENTYSSSAEQPKSGEHFNGICTTSSTKEIQGSPGVKKKVRKYHIY
jgi:hypothetical protein